MLRLCLTLVLGIWGAWLILIALLFFGGDERMQRILIMAALMPQIVTRIVHLVLYFRRRRSRREAQAESLRKTSEVIANLEKAVSLEDERFQQRLARHTAERHAAGGQRDVESTSGR